MSLYLAGICLAGKSYIDQIRSIEVQTINKTKIACASKYANNVGRFFVFFIE